MNFGGEKFGQCSSYDPYNIDYRLSDSNLEHLMKIAIEGPPLKDVDFNAIIDIFKPKIGVLNFNLNNYKNKNIYGKLFGGGGRISQGSLSLYEPLVAIQ